MCGIVGLLSYGKKQKKEENVRQEIMRFLTTELLMQTEERGKDATGIATLFDDGDFMCQKMGIPASEFVFRHGGEETDYDGYMKLWSSYDKPAKIVLAHCRKSSVGNITNNGNNHPVRVGNICVVHNGTLTNHAKIFENLNIKRDNDVDTEAIAQLLKYYTKNGEHPWTIKALKKVNEKLSGSYAVLAFNADNPYQLAVMRDTRPIDVCWIKSLDMAVLVSDDKFVKTTLMRYKLMRRVYGRFDWPSIGTDDVVIRSLGNMHLSVFNLLDSPKNVTSISDIAEDINTPYSYNSPWHSRSSYSHSNNRFDDDSGASKASAVGFKSDHVKKPPKHVEEKTNRVAGKVWNKELYKYTNVNESDIKRSTKDGNSVIDLDYKSPDAGSSFDPTGISLKQCEFDSSEPISGVKVIDLSNGSINNKPHDVLDAEYKAMKNAEDTNIVDTVSVDMAVNVEAIQLANEGSRDVLRFSNDVDLCNSLNIKDISILNKLPTHSLANMVQNNSWKAGFMAGFNNVEKSSPIIKKGSYDTNNVRTLKAVIDITSHTIGEMMERSDFVHDAVANNIIDKAVNKNVKDNAMDLAISRLNNVFSEGDRNKNPVIKNITEKVKDAQQKL